uniref:RNA polymerase sigma factor n=1 Tax=Paractinoplanes polyasparticus TaxID=2856853 RepID=UPI001C844B95|nr:sigma-70 region 4 domain-containing protein [Actinoplanes polyasparticus]
MRTAPRDAWVQTFDANEDVDKVLYLLEELPPAQREVLVMAEEGIPDKEIAAIIGKKEATVRSTLRHAREKVTNALNLKRPGRR